MYLGTGSDIIYNVNIVTRLKIYFTFCYPSIHKIVTSKVIPNGSLSTRSTRISCNKNNFMLSYLSSHKNIEWEVTTYGLKLWEANMFCYFASQSDMYWEILHTTKTTHILQSQILHPNYTQTAMLKGLDWKSKKC